MVRLHLKGINTARKCLADGSIKKYYYHRGTGKRIKDWNIPCPLPDPFGGH